MTDSTVPKRKLVAKRSLPINGGMYRKDDGTCSADPPMEEESEEKEEPMKNVKAHMRNHSSGRFSGWDWKVGIGMFLVEMLGMMIYGFFHLSANYVFPGAVGTERRSLIIAAAVFMVKITSGRWTSAHLDPVRSIASTIAYIFTRGKDVGKGKVWMELLKLPIFIIAQWIGFMMALTLFGLWTDTAIKTTDCAASLITPAVCSVYPIRDVGVTVSSLDWMEVFGSLLIYGTFVWGESFFGWGYPDILFSALFYGGGHYLVHMLFSTASGGSFNFWYWSMTSWFSNITDPNKASYVWPLMVGVFIVMLINVLIYYIVDRLFGKDKYEVVNEKMY